jgi:DNA-binding NarL/FixJ family response regulator
MTVQLPGKRIKVVIHSADPLTRAGVVSHLRHQPAVEVVERIDADGSTPRDGVALILTDRLDDGSVTTLRRLVREAGQRVVLITGQLREPELMSVVESGVQAILWRQHATPERLVQVLRSAARGEGHLPPDLLTRVLTQVGRVQRGVSQGEAVPSPIGLTTREVDVLRLIADGLETKQIAEKLAYSERTIKNVLYGLMNRLQLHNRAHAVAHALREGYI